jgi:hypothetical protein
MGRSRILSLPSNIHVPRVQAKYAVKNRYAVPQLLQERNTGFESEEETVSIQLSKSDKSLLSSAVDKLVIVTGTPDVFCNNNNRLPILFEPGTPTDKFNEMFLMSICFIGKRKDNPLKKDYA